MTKNELKEEYIAPCGINCMICLGFLRAKNPCPGCKKLSSNCVIKNCKELNNNSYTYCYECSKFPCRRIKQLDNRYKTQYKYSVIDSLLKIKKDGAGSFINNDSKKWICPECGGIICIHRGYCIECKKIYYIHAGNKRKLPK